MKWIFWIFLLPLLVACASPSKGGGNSGGSDSVPLSTVKTKLDDGAFEVINDAKVIEQQSVVKKLQKSQKTLGGIDSKLYRMDGVYLEQILLSTDLLFDSGKAGVKPETKQLIYQLFEQIKPSLNDEYLIVVGHTDSVGSAQYNMGLSLERAMAVIKQMEEIQLPTERINAIAAGEQLPLYSNSNVEGRAANRRVEIYLSRERTLALDFLRQIRCPDAECGQSDLSVLSINREFRLAEDSADASIPNTLRVFSQKANEAKVRDFEPLLISIRSLKIDVEVRELRLLKGKYLAPRER